MRPKILGVWCITCMLFRLIGFVALRYVYRTTACDRSALLQRFSTCPWSVRLYLNLACHPALINASVMSALPPSDASHPDRFTPDSPPLHTLPANLPLLEDDESYDEYYKSIAGYPYNGFDPFLIRAREICFERLDKFNSSVLTSKQRRELVAEWMSLSVKEPRGHTENVYLLKPFICEYVSDTDATMIT